MSREPAVRRRWWLTHVALPILALGALAVLLGRSQLDARSLEFFYREGRGEFPLRDHWYFNGVLHLGGKYIVIALTAGLLLLAAFGLRSPLWRPWSGRFAYLAACVVATSVVGGAWKKLANQVTPWNTDRFGGQQPWPGTDGDTTFFDHLGSPGAHAASGFAWVALYFVGASLGARQRALWLAPGLVLGSLFALTQHVRGAHQPSHEPWSLAIAWVVAVLLAVLFRRLRWMEWSELSTATGGAPSESARERSAAIPWLLAACGLFGGTFFFSLDMLIDAFEVRLERVHHWFEGVELLLMGPGAALAFYLLAERWRSTREQEGRRVEAEREQRFQLLGRMAASVAHEVRNPLHSLRLIVDEQRHEVRGLKDHPLQPELEACIARIDRAVELVYRLARPGSAEEETVDLAKTVREAVEALVRTTPRRVNFLMEHFPARAPVRSSPPALRIVVDNLLRNALEAVGEDATIPLSLTREDHAWLLCVRNPGRLARSRDKVPATGGGHAENLGLGLAISRQIASGSGARIDLIEDAGTVRCDLRWPALADGSRS